MIYKTFAISAFAAAGAFVAQAQGAPTPEVPVSPIQLQVDSSYFILQGAPLPAPAPAPKIRSLNDFGMVSVKEKDQTDMNFGPSTNLPINLQEGLYYRIEPKTDQQRYLNEQRNAEEPKKTGWAQIGETLIDEGTVGYKFENNIFLEVDQMNIDASTGNRQLDEQASKYKEDFWGLRVTLRR